MVMPERLEDQYTSIYKQGKRHTTYTHLGCVILRIVLGLLIYFKLGIFKNILFLIVLFMLVIIVFSYKLYITKNKTWKVYIRTISLYTISLIIDILDNYKYKTFNTDSRNISGILIMLDAIMGLQARHIQNNFKE